MSTDFKEIERKMIGRELLRRQGKALDEDRNYEFSEALGLVPKDLARSNAERSSVEPMVAPAKWAGWMEVLLAARGNMWEQILAGLRSPAFIRVAVVLLVIALPFSFFLGRQSSSVRQSGERSNSDPNYGVAALRYLLGPDPTSKDELDAARQVLIGYLRERPHEDLLRVRLIQISRIEVGLLPEGTLKQEIIESIMAQSKKLPNDAFLKASEGPLPLP